jgi:hypothetical protein
MVQTEAPFLPLFKIPGSDIFRAASVIIPGDSKVQNHLAQVTWVRATSEGADKRLVGARSHPRDTKTPSSALPVLVCSVGTVSHAQGFDPILP